MTIALVIVGLVVSFGLLTWLMAAPPDDDIDDDRMTW